MKRFCLSLLDRVPLLLGDMARILSLILVQLLSWYLFNIVSNAFLNSPILLQRRTGFCAGHNGRSILDGYMS